MKYYAYFIVVLMMMINWSTVNALSLTQCKNACSGGASTREEFCRNIPSNYGVSNGASVNEVKAGCWSKVYESTINCQNWCAWWF